MSISTKIYFHTYTDHGKICKNGIQRYRFTYFYLFHSKTVIAYHLKCIPDRKGANSEVRRLVKLFLNCFKGSHYC